MKQPIRFSDVFARLRGVTVLLALFSLCSLAQADANTGRKTYLSSCGGCHGASEDAPGFAPDLRRFQGDEHAFLSVVKNGRPGTIMSGWQGVLSDDDIMSIRSYLNAGPATDSHQRAKSHAPREETLAAR